MNNIFLLALLSVFVIKSLQEDIAGQKQPPRLIFYVEQSVEQDEDFIELSLTIQAQQTSLTSAMNKCQNILNGVKTASEDYCKEEGGQDCENIVESDNFDVEFKYQRIRREPKFVGFVVKRDAVITLIKTENIGLLVDKLLALGVYKINKAEWKAFNEKDPEQVAIDTGIKQGQDLCGHLDKQLGQVLLIQEIFKEEAQEEGQGDEEEEDDMGQEEQQTPTVLKFQVQCIEKEPEEKKPKKKKK